MNYEFCVERKALAKLLVLSERARWRLHDRFAEIAAHPSAEPDLRLRDASGRTICVRLDGDWLIHYWVDDASRRVLVVNLEATDDAEDV